VPEDAAVFNDLLIGLGENELVTLNAVSDDPFMPTLPIITTRGVALSETKTILLLLYAAAVVAKLHVGFAIFPFVV
jgi:hypothetical protein